MAESKKAWEKRLGGEPSELTVDFVESLSVDKRLYKYDIVGSIAHAQMLAEQKLITKSEFAQIKEALIEISNEITEGKFAFDKSYAFYPGKFVQFGGDGGKGSFHVVQNRQNAQHKHGLCKFADFLSILFAATFVVDEVRLSSLPIS